MLQASLYVAQSVYVATLVVRRTPSAACAPLDWWRAQATPMYSQLGYEHLHMGAPFRPPARSTLQVRRLTGR